MSWLELTRHTRSFRFLLTLAVAAIGLIWPAGLSSASAHELSDDGTAFPSAFHNHFIDSINGAVEVPTQATTKTGTLMVLWGDGQADSGRAHRQDLVLTTDAGERLLLDPDKTNLPAGGLLSLDHQRVTVSGGLQISRAGNTAPQAASGVIKNASLQAADGHSATAAPMVSGSQRWATVLCRFADSPGVTPRNKAYFESLLGGTTPGLDHYWRELSYNNANISGSIVVGWYNLPKSRSAYVTRDSQNDEVADLNALASDCTGAADADVYFPDFVGVNLMFNGELDGFAWGGTNYLARDGQSKLYRTTWMPTWGYGNQDVLAHEMGHGFGLPHSSGAYNTPYDSMWDPMSAGGTCAPADATYGCIAVHTIAYHKDLLGWIPADRKYTAGGASNQTITIERIDTLPTTSGTYLMAKIPFGSGGTTFYTVESRRSDGYDGGSGYKSHVPGEAVLIHKVNTALSDRQAQVVDPDNNGNPNDASAIWGVGETFTDQTNQISVAVLSSTSTGYVVQIQKGGVASTATLTVTPAGTGSGTVVSSPSGINCGVDCTETVNTNTVVTMSATPASGSTFGGWSGACSGTTTCVVTMTANKSVGATFTTTTTTPVSLTVTPAGSGSGRVSSSPSGIDCGIDCTESITANSVVTLTATPTSGSTFGGWSGACSGTSTCVLTMTTNKSVGATFTAPVSLTVSPAGSGSGTVSSSPSGINCGADCTESVTVNSVVTLSAAPASGSTFGGWSGNCSGTSNCVLTMTANKSVGATFTKAASPTLTLASGTTSVQTGATIGVGYTNPTPSGNDKVSLHALGASDSTSISSQSANKTSGSLSFKAPSTKGSYEFRFFRNGVKVATSGTLSVTGPPTADLVVGVTESADPVKKSTNLTYTITVTNNGPDGATAVNLTDVLPSRATYGSVTTTQGKCSHTSTTKVTCSLGNLASQASARITLTIKPTRAGSNSNTVSVTATQADPASGNNKVTTLTTVN